MAKWHWAQCWLCEHYFHCSKVHDEYGCGSDVCSADGAVGDGYIYKGCVDKKYKRSPCLVYKRNRPD